MKEATESMFAVGEPVTWLHVPRGGYGYVCPALAYVVAIRPKRIGIAVASAYGSDWLPRWVKPESLRPRVA